MTIDNKWISVTENINTGQLKNGKNTLFFNRRVDENYQYKIRNLRIEFIKSKKKSIHLTDAVVHNIGGIASLTGFVSTDINAINVYNNIIPLSNGFFEHLLTDIPKETKALVVNYTDALGRQYQDSFPVIYKDQHPSLDFTKSLHENIGKTYFISTNEVECIDYDGNLNITFTENEIKNSYGGLLVEGLKFKDIKPLDSDLRNVTAGKFSGYRIKHLNFSDSVAAHLHLRYDPEKIPAGYTEKDIKTFYFDKTQLLWKAIAVDSLDIANNEIISTIYNNDTDYINGVIKVPESPEAGNFTPTMISDMKYADPAAGIVSIPPPSPNSTGGLTTSFPIKLPQGRNGMQPNLQVVYNSDAGNGLMGVGWSISTPAITINSKWGAPRFDTAFESEIYSLHGEDLVLKATLNGVETYTNPHRHANIPRVHEREFYLRKEGSYLKILRHGTGMGNYWWEVIDKHGTKSYYGGKPGTNSDTNSTIKTTTSLQPVKAAHWGIKRVEDQYGNYMEYIYTPPTYPTPLLVPGTEIVARKFDVSKITYSIHPGVSSYYEVNFSKSYNTSPMTPLPVRKDIIVNVRNGYYEIINDLLTEIVISFRENGLSSDPRRVWFYRFDYKETAFQKQQLVKISEYDAARTLFYTNTIEYYNEVGDENLLVLPESSIFGQNTNDNINGTGCCKEYLL